MITLSVDICNPVSQDFYDKTIYNLQFHQLVCTCGHSGCLTIHGYYDRSVKHDDSCLRLRICRVICSVCGRTHALLLSSLVPYSQISTKEQADICRHSQSDNDFSSIMDNTPSIDEAVSAPLFAVFTCTGNSVCSPKTYLSYLIQYLSNGAFLPSTGSSCRLKALRIFYF